MLIIINLLMVPATIIMMLLSVFNMDLSMVLNSGTLKYLLSLCHSMTMDYMSLSCLSMLCFCFMLAGVYYWHYFSWHSDYLMMKMQGFVLSMTFLMISSDVVSSFIGWELLGMSSFFLMLYYSTYYSSRAASMTVLSSRLGDVGFFMFITCVMSDCIDSASISCCVFVCLLLMSKSAVFPLTSWLLEAMRAPTPVSSLVHSSTLVAAGMVLMCRYENHLIGGPYSYIFLMVCLTTIILSASAAFFYCDTKKIIALSTCNNMSWCYVYLYKGMVELCLIQLVCHGVFKCVLFCLMGDLLMKSNNSQNKSMHFYFGSVSYSIMISLVCLFMSGAPFLGVYFSKHMFIGYLCEVESLSIMLFSLLGLSLSFLYTFRLLNVVNSDLKTSSKGFNKMFYVYIKVVPLLLITNSLISKSVLEDFMPGSTIILLVNISMLTMSSIGYSLYHNSLSRWNVSLYGQDFFVFDSLMLLSAVEKIGYNLSMFRWEFSVMAYLTNLRIEYSLGVSFLLVMSMMFYILILM